MIRLGRAAERHVTQLLRHYARLGRPEAGDNLLAALDLAGARIEQNPGGGFVAPRPYPALARPGIAWVKTGSYWFAYGTTPPLMIVGIFYEKADIPGRL
ncbi:MAG: hypothetical protein WDN04_02670 [Rhodospirillales bacterium]